MILAEVSDGVFPGRKSPTEGFGRAVFNLELRVYSSPPPQLGVGSGVGSGVTGVTSPLSELSPLSEPPSGVGVGVSPPVLPPLI